MNKRLSGLFILVLLQLCYYAAAQSDTMRRQLDEFSVTANKGSKTVQALTSLQVATQDELQKMPVIQVSDVLKHFSGITVRDYGGVGGMKTVSVRGFGSQHTLVAYDGIAVSDCQSGQVDLSKFSMQNVESVDMTIGAPDDIFLPARLFSAAGLLRINTIRPIFSDKKPVNVKLSILGGSFGLFNPSLLLENRIYKGRNGSPLLITSSLNVNYLQCDGHYPFVLHYGGETDSTSNERRTNTDVRTLSAEENLFFHFNDHSELDLKVCYYRSERGLPGAVVFYNTKSRQRLDDENIFAQTHYHNIFSPKFAYQVNAKFTYSYQRYIDPDYLNVERRLDNRYIQREAYLSNTFRYTPIRLLAFSISNDLIFSNLYENTEDFSMPSRFTSLTSLYMFLDSKYVDVSAGVLHTYAHNSVKTGEAADDCNRFSPSVSIAIKPIPGEAFYIRAFYKDIFRLPTFNDLYYRLVGNINLKPEQTMQLDFGLSYASSFSRRIQIEITTDGYYNTIKEKIVAIPNKNLFVWTMLNLGKVEMAGASASLNFSYKIIEQLKLSLSGNYTYQYAVDVTDHDSKTYLHQIPYTPRHSGSAIASVSTPWFDLSYTLLVSGKRYMLQQNIPANELEGYADHSIVLSKNFPIKKVVELGLRVELLNLANKNYEIVKNYPMQGRSFRIAGHIKW